LGNAIESRKQAGRTGSGARGFPSSLEFSVDVVQKVHIRELSPIPSQAYGSGDLTERSVD
jgi:hypothetical protein